MTTDISSDGLRCLCAGSRFTLVFSYDEPPKGEVRFQFSEENAYRRKVFRCEACGHFLSVHHMNMEALYGAEYVNSTYGAHGIRQAFNRINGLDPSRSDNMARARRVREFASAHSRSSAAPSSPSILDVGSGLCVFLYRMKQAGWTCTALDPDPRAILHAKEAAGVDEAVRGDFMQLTNLGPFDVVTFNKVLEHVKDPIQMLAKARGFLNPTGFVYLEVPDGEVAALDGPGREEFFIDHWHVFSAVSILLLAKRAGFRMENLERIHEPSGKYTLCAFLVPAIHDGGTLAVPLAPLSDNKSSGKSGI